MIDISEYQQIPQCILRRLGGGGTSHVFVYIGISRGFFLSLRSFFSFIATLIIAVANHGVLLLHEV